MNWPVDPDPRIRELVRNLELTVTRKLDGILQGHYQGLTPGQGSEPGESRLYQVGDDVRRIDWNVTARTRELHVRELIADRDLEAWMVVDASPSMAFGTAKAEKRTVALSAAAAVGFLTARHHNKIGALVGSGNERRALPPRPGRDQVRAILATIANAPSVAGSGRTDLGAMCHDAGRRARRTGFVCVISDFLSAGWKNTLGSLAARHDVLAIEVLDPRELDLPAVGTLDLVDPATGQRREVRLTESVRRRYAAAAAAQRSAIHDDLIAAGAKHLQLRTDGEWVADIVRFVQFQRRPGMAGARLNASRLAGVAR
jgi:uncharacterized protein (DUF58 family)